MTEHDSRGMSTDPGILSRHYSGVVPLLNYTQTIVAIASHVIQPNYL